MQADCSDNTVTKMPARESAEGGVLSQVLYKAAIITAILLFLIGFWSC
jgi:hypothetical protein